MMMIKRLGVTVGTLLVAGAFLTPSAMASAGNLTTSPTGVEPIAATEEKLLDSGRAGNGGSYGIGNCGFNASGGSKAGAPVGSDVPGLGGFKKGDPCMDLNSDTVVIGVGGGAY